MKQTKILELSESDLNTAIRLYLLNQTNYIETTEKITLINISSRSDGEGNPMAVAFVHIETK
jgi:hypothetical protein